jgi:probable F420-dependent oxidoreductase
VRLHIVLSSRIVTGVEPPAEQSSRPFRFGLSASDTRPGVEWAALARTVEASGFDVLLQSDHLVPALSPFTSLAHAAAVTERLRVGTLVLNNDLRHPVITAREAASLDVLSGGRVELGVGAGHMRFEYDEVGIRFDPARMRVGRLEEAVAVIRGLLAGEEVSLDGAHYQLAGHQLGFDTPQRPVPLLVGGNGDRVLALAAQQADIVGLVGFGHREADTQVRLTHFGEAGLAERIAHVRAAAGDRFASLELSVLVQRVEITDDAEAAVQPLVERLDGVPAADILASPFVLIGTVDELVTKLHDLRRRSGVSYVACFEAALEPMTEVIEAVRSS